MKSWLNVVMDRFFHREQNTARRVRRYSPEFEVLESRSLLSATAGSAWAPFGASPKPGVIITFGAKGSVTVDNTGVGPYDGDDDTYVGVINNSGKAIPSLKISADSSRKIFGFDNDGIQTYGSPAPAVSNLTGYEGPDNFFSGISDNGTSSLGTVNFIGKGLLSGQQTYFSLEGPPQRVEVGVDLSVSIDNAKITPTQATDLHLNQFYGGESLRIPVKIDNLGSILANGQVTLQLALSTTPDMKGIVGTPVSQNQSIAIAPSGSNTFNVDFNLGSTSKLTVGAKYYFVIKLTSKTIVENDAVNGVDTNNIAASATTYQYLGKPVDPAVFTSGEYFNIVRDTLKAVNPFAYKGLAQPPATGKEFTAIFESPGGYNDPTTLGPYLDSVNIPTIGIGINLTAIDSPTNSSIKGALATAVRTYYHGLAANHASGYMNIDTYNDDRVITMLKNQAIAAGKGNQGPTAMTTADAKHLFDVLYQTHEDAAKAALGKTVPSNVLWVLTDIRYNLGSLSMFPHLLADLKLPNGPDLIQAGFDFVDAKRTTDVKHYRTLAGFEYLVQGHESQLGNLI